MQGPHESMPEHPHGSVEVGGERAQIVDRLRSAEDSLKELEKEAKSHRIQGVVLLLIGAAMILPAGSRVFGVPWWWLILPMLFLGLLSFRLGMFIGKRRFEKRFGPGSPFSEALEEVRTLRQRSNPDRTGDGDQDRGE